MPWFQRAVVSDEKLLIWRAVVIMKAEVFSFTTSHHSTKSDKNFPLFWGRYQRGTQIGPYIRTLAGKLLSSNFSIPTLLPLRSPEYLDLLREDLQDSREESKENVSQSVPNSVMNSFGDGAISVPQLHCNLNSDVLCISFRAVDGITQK